MTLLCDNSELCTSVTGAHTTRENSPRNCQINGKMTLSEDALKMGSIEEWDINSPQVKHKLWNKNQEGLVVVCKINI